MNKYARNMMSDRAMRDMRNPYGARGGYISSRRPRRDRDMEDMTSHRMGRYEFQGRGEYDRAGYDREYDSRRYDRTDRDMGYTMEYNDYPYESDRDMDMEMDYARRRSSRTGRYIRDRRMRDYRDDYDYEDDYGYDYGDETAKLTSKDIEKWKKEMHNADGTKGEHYTKEQVEQVAKNIGLNLDKYGKEEFCLAMNMLYSDYCQTALKFGINRPEFFADLAKSFLDDKDFDGEGKEKLALYYKCIVEKD